MPQKSDSDQTFCSIIEPSQEAVRVVVRNRNNRFKWKKFHTAVLRSSRKKPRKSPSVCSDVLIPNSELMKSQVESGNQVASVGPDEVVSPPIVLQETQSSVGIVPATQCSNKPKRPRPERRGRPRKQVDRGVQTSPVTSNKLEISERQVEKLSKKLKLRVGELKAMIEQVMTEEDGHDTSETESVISNSQKSFRMPARPRWSRSAEEQRPPPICVPMSQKSDSQVSKPVSQMPKRVSQVLQGVSQISKPISHQMPKGVSQMPKPAVSQMPKPVSQMPKRPKPISQMPKPAFLHPPPPMRPFFTPVPATPERPAAHQRRYEFAISPKTYKELTQSPTSRINRVKLNFSTLRASPKLRKPSEHHQFSKEWDRAFAVRPAKHRRNLFFEDNEVQSNQCTSTVFDDGNSLFDCGDNDKFFLDDSLDLLCI